MIMQFKIFTFNYRKSDKSPKNARVGEMLTRTRKAQVGTIAIRLLEFGFYNVSVFCKLAIFWVVIGLSENFTLRAPKCRYDDKYLAENDYSEACDSIFQTFHLMDLSLIHI